ncbi:hypothetical protein VCHENC02_1858 [Vibrio harveyi]|uniref:Uncharacterized protein n=1 Tax=Vibrio harveyi TaxID=669 RepID=A0A454D1Q2_VIBHA|nr:hypothetical protein VCHENC02_1858 [Vibrio harveyi]
MSAIWRGNKIMNGLGIESGHGLADGIRLTNNGLDDFSA